MNLFKYLILILLFASCSNKEVQLPKIGETGLNSIENHSSIWFFIEINKNDTTLTINKNNKITNTNLIFNIDKRLTLLKVMPELAEIQEKLKEDSMHKKEGMKNYFNYADTVSNSFSLLEFTETNYIFSKQDFEKYTKELRENDGQESILLDIKTNGIEVDLNITDNYLDDLRNIIEKDSVLKTKILTKFNGQIPYQKYLTIKTELLNNGFSVQKSEYIYTEE